MNNLNDEELQNGNPDESQEVIQEPAKIEKISLTEITQEIEKQKDEKTEELVMRIIDKISEID